jgi:hypothetical protein
MERFFAMGVTERINIYGTMLWVAVLATALLRVPWNGPRGGDHENRSRS